MAGVGDDLNSGEMNLLDDSPLVPPGLGHSSLLQQDSEDSKVNLSPVKDESLCLPTVHTLNLRTFAAQTPAGQEPDVGAAAASH